MIKRIFSILLVLVAIVVLGGAYFWFFIPFSDSGVKAGVLNNFKHKGVIFKTYEGELIQSGFRPGQTGLMSNEFQFSVEDKAVADKLMSLGGAAVQLHYKEFYGKLPWRGFSKYVVDSIVEMPISQSQGLRNDLELPPPTIE